MRRPPERHACRSALSFMPTGPMARQEATLYYRFELLSSILKLPDRRRMCRETVTVFIRW